MKFNCSFQVQVLCKVYPVNDTDDSKVEDKLVVLDIDLATAERILYRFEDPGFMLGKYKFLYKFDHLNKPKMITLFYEDLMYLMMNTNEFLNEVMQGYKVLLKIDDLIDTSTFDYKAAVDVLQNEDTNIKKNVDDEGERYSAYI